MALLAAQRKLGLRLDQDPWRHGIRQADPYVVLVSEQAHYCVDRAVRIMGWGPDAVVLVKTDAHHRMDVDDLTHQAREVREQGKQLLAVVGSACTTSAGAYDPLDRIAEWAHTEEVWFHVDGAHGAPAGFSNTHKHLVRGMSLADSVVLDFHKVCGLPGPAHRRPLPRRPREFPALRPRSGIPLGACRWTRLVGHRQADV